MKTHFVQCLCVSSALFSTVINAAGVKPEPTITKGNTMPSTAPHESVFSVGPNLFIDDFLIAESAGLKRTTHQPEKRAEPVFHVTPGNVLYDADNSRYRMWYTELTPQAYALAESKDCITWNKPDMGLIDVAGAKPNNFIDAPKGCFTGQLLDEGPGFADPARRYKLAYFVAGKGMCVTFAADGLRFTPYAGNPVIREAADETPAYKPGYTNLISDVINGCWDPMRKEYLVIGKAWRGGYPGFPHHAVNGWRRCVVMTTSRDFVSWETPKIIITPDPKNGLEEFYSFTPMVRGNLYLGFLRVLRDDLPATPGGAVEGVGWTELVTSRDGCNWTRHQEKFLDRDLREGRFDHAFAWCGTSVTVGDKEYFLYAALLSGHKTDRNNGRKTGLAIMRKNGFVSRDADVENGRLRTPPGVFPGDTLTVNAVVRGELRVRFLDGKGNVIRGFDWADSIPVQGDSVAHRLAWRGQPRLPRDHAIAMEFSLRDADLYGFDFGL